MYTYIVLIKLCEKVIKVLQKIQYHLTFMRTYWYI